MAMDGVRKKSLRELLPKDEFDSVAKRSRKRQPEIIETPAGLDIDCLSQTAPRATARRFRPARWQWILLGLIILAGGYFLSSFFSSATIKITPREAVVAISGQFEANRAPATGLEFYAMKLSDSLSKTVPATGQVKQEIKAKGTVTITNNFSGASQKLISGTRFSTIDGRIYRLDATITVPGQTKTGGQLLPGRMVAKVTADVPGAEYNTEKIALKIVGFKGTAKYDKFTVEAGLIAGGVQGMIGVVKEADARAAIAAAQAELKERLEQKARRQIPKDNFLLADGMQFSFSDQIVPDEVRGSSTVIEISADLTALMFSQKNLSEYLAAKQFPDETVEGIRLANPTALKFQLLGQDISSAAQAKKINFNLAGKVKFVWPVSTGELVAKLKGISFSRRDQVFSSFPNIYRAEAYIRPPWIRTFPDNPDKINIILLTQKL